MFEEYNLSVHEIVDFLLRKGDIDNRVFNAKTMQEGSKIHKIYQKNQGSSYLSEVPLKCKIIVDNKCYLINGRADGIIIENDLLIIDEIKTTIDNIDDFYEKNYEWHLGQAQFYAYMYANENDFNKIKITLTYINQNTFESKKKEFFYDFKTIKNIIEDYLKSYSNILSTLNIRKKEMYKSLKNFTFPYKNVRPGQEKFIDFIESTLKNNDYTFIEASTGIGKTAGSIYASLKGIKDKSVDKVFYLIAKNTGFQSSNKALKKFESAGLTLNSIEIYAKEKSCINYEKKGHCNPSECKYAQNYYTNLNELIKKTILENTIIEHSLIEKIAKENNICPYEFSLDLSLFCSIIVCDYNYVFNPTSQLKRYFENPDKNYNLVGLVDEAHNLVNRSKDIYSELIDFHTFIDSKKELKVLNNKKIKNILKTLTKFFNQYKEFEYDEYLKLEKLDDDFIKSLNKYSKLLFDFQTEISKIEKDKTDNFSRSVYRFLLIYDLFKENNKYFSIFLKKSEDNFSINLRCLDASTFIKKTVEKFNSLVFFSGTLSPINYYKNCLLGNENYKNLFIPSPFNKNNYKFIVNTSLSLLYKNRLDTLDEVVNETLIFINGKIGNYLIYCPSFEYLILLKNKLKNLKSFNFIYQERNMNEEDKDKFIKNFKENPKETVIGICVLGGVFSEGIDLPEDRLIGVEIIGIGLPTINYETNLIKDYYDSCGKNGFNYAYSSLAINKIMQAAGRLIRTEKDKGLIFLIDFRYKNDQYKELFNNAWSNHVFINNSKQLLKEINNFYNKN